MLVGVRASFAVVVIVIAALASSCALSPAPLSWRIEAQDAELAERIETVEARILRGGCGGVPVFRVVVHRGGAMGPVPPVLAPGVWGFDVRANDRSCLWIGESCAELTLPGAREVVSRLRARSASQACPTARCAAGECLNEDMDFDGATACGEGEPVGTCDCNDGDASVRPGAEDACGDGDDQDCDELDDACDADCDGFPEGTGVVDGLDCDDDDATVHPNGSPRDLWGLADGDRLARGCDAMPMPPAASDACTMGGSGEPMGDAIDQDCNGFVDDGPGCTDPDDRDRDGAIACSGSTTTGCDTNDCDPGIAPSREERCGNGIDEDGDDTTPDACDPADADGDGQRALTMGGADCDDTDAQVFLGAPDDCRTRLDESCGSPVDCAGDEDGDGYVGRPASGRGDCNDRDPAVRPFADEDPCDGDDDDCDGIVDEVVRARDATPGVPDGCVRAAGAAVPVDYDVTRASTDHCGACGAATAAHEDCCAGVPTAVDVPESCGVCGFACGEHSTCVATGSNEDGGTFACECASDPMGAATWADCDGSLGRGGGDGCETDTESDPRHCGACGNACGPQQQCVDGTCTCEGSYLDCDGTDTTGCEINGANDLAHCGRCSMACSFANAAAACTMGTCELGTCATDFGDCDGMDSTGCEVSFSSLPNCGRCGETCVGVQNATEACVMRRCDYTRCDATYGDCDGNRVNGCETLLRSVTVCGTCGTNCNTTVASAVGRSCTGAGLCDYASCLSGFGDCDGTRVNGCESALNTTTRCGACGTVCGAGETCSAGGDCTCGATVAPTGEACPGALSCVAGACA